MYRMMSALFYRVILRHVLLACYLCSLPITFSNRNDRQGHLTRSRLCERLSSASLGTPQQHDASAHVFLWHNSHGPHRQQARIPHTFNPSAPVVLQISSVLGFLVTWMSWMSTFRRVFASGWGRSLRVRRPSSSFRTARQSSSSSWSLCQSSTSLSRYISLFKLLPDIINP